MSSTNNAAPACITVSNVQGRQSFFYCGATRVLVTTSYTNLMATTTAPVSVTGLNPASPSATPITFHGTSLSTGTTVGIAIGCAAAVVLIILLLVCFTHLEHLFHPRLRRSPIRTSIDGSSDGLADDSTTSSPADPSNPDATSPSELAGSSPADMPTNGRMPWSPASFDQHRAIDFSTDTTLYGASPSSTSTAVNPGAGGPHGVFPISPLGDGDEDDHAGRQGQGGSESGPARVVAADAEQLRRRAARALEQLANLAELPADTLESLADCRAAWELADS